MYMNNYPIYCVMPSSAHHSPATVVVYYMAVGTGSVPGVHGVMWMSSAHGRCLVGGTGLGDEGMSKKICRNYNKNIPRSRERVLDRKSTRLNSSHSS